MTIAELEVEIAKTKAEIASHTDYGPTWQLRVRELWQLEDQLAALRDGQDWDCAKK